MKSESGGDADDSNFKLCQNMIKVPVMKPASLMSDLKYDKHLLIFVKLGDLKELRFF